LGQFWELIKGQSNIITNGTKQWGISQHVTVLLNPASLHPVPIREETEDEVVETDMELSAEEFHDLLYDLDTPDEDDEWEDIK
jgi:hypothetical protein